MQAWREYGAAWRKIAVEWDDAYAVALGTSRIALSGPVAELQRIRREWREVEPPEGLGEFHENMVAFQDATIEGFLAFMAEKPDWEVGAHFDYAHRYYMHAFDSTSDEYLARVGLVRPTPTPIPPPTPKPTFTPTPTITPTPLPPEYAGAQLELLELEMAIDTETSEYSDIVTITGEVKRIVPEPKLISITAWPALDVYDSKGELIDEYLDLDVYFDPDYLMLYPDESRSFEIEAWVDRDRGLSWVEVNFQERVGVPKHPGDRGGERIKKVGSGVIKREDAVQESH